MFKPFAFLAVCLVACTPSSNGVDSWVVLAPGEQVEIVEPGIFPSSLTCSALPSVVNGAPASYRRTFFDDFEGAGVDWARWQPHFDGGWDQDGQRWLGYDWFVKRTLQGNYEQEIYVDPGYKGRGKSALGLNPFVLSNGKLNITANRTPPEFKDSLYGYEYVSGVLTSRASFVQRYGFFEMRARVPKGKALWPAFWLLPEDKSWPPEIDVLEVVGQTPEVIASAIHWKDPVDGAHKSTGCRTTIQTSASEFHQYGVMWDARRIVYYIDRRPVGQVLTPPGMDRRMYMILNLAVGGSFVGVADSETPMPAVFSVDWVAAYEKMQ